MTFTQALAAAVLALLLEEDPSLERKPKTMNEWRANITELADYHVTVGSAGHLVSPHIDALLLSTVNYAESRFRLPAPGGDCYWTHEFQGVPSMRWPRGYEPKLRQVCPALGPMQVAQGNVSVLPTWQEIQTLFPGRDWTIARMMREELKDPRTNITVAYGILWHLKESCPNREQPASAASWLTAYRWGRCTPQHHTRRYYDRESKLRCSRLEHMQQIIQANDMAVEMPDGWTCRD